jgi:hypothetical protein
MPRIRLILIILLTSLAGCNCDSDSIDRGINEYDHLHRGGPAPQEPGTSAAGQAAQQPTP